MGAHCIYQSPSGIKVYQNFLYRWLTFDSAALQTLINRSHPEKPELNYLKPLTFAVRTQPDDCCLLGLGGAGVAHALTPYINHSQLHIVENNIEVIEIAATYFMASRLKQVTVIHQDANLFAQECSKRYQHLLIDLFDAHAFPSQCHTPCFFTNCQRLLHPNGIFALNIANPYEQWPLFKLVRNSFGHCTITLQLKSEANMVIFACHGPSIKPLIALFKNSREIKALSWDSRWGWVARMNC